MEFVRVARIANMKSSQDLLSCFNAERTRSIKDGAINVIYTKQRENMLVLKMNFSM